MSKFMDAKMRMDMVLAKKQIVAQSAADVIVKEYMSAASKEKNKELVVKQLQELLKDFSDQEKFLIMAYVFAKIA